MYAKELFFHWDEVRHDLLRAVDMLSDAQLDFVPRAGLWSVRQVLVHIANAEAGWIQYVVAQNTKSWDEAGIDDASYPTVDSVKKVLKTVHDKTDAYLETLPIEALDQMCKTAWGGPDASVRWILWHVLEHEIHHRGEIYLMLGLMGMEGPDI